MKQDALLVFYKSMNVLGIKILLFFPLLDKIKPEITDECASTLCYPVRGDTEANRSHSPWRGDPHLVLKPPKTFLIFYRYSLLLWFNCIKLNTINLFFLSINTFKNSERFLHKTIYDTFGLYISNFVQYRHVLLPLFGSRIIKLLYWFSRTKKFYPGNLFLGYHSLLYLFLQNYLLKEKKYEVLVFPFVIWIYDFIVQILLGGDSFCILDVV